MKPKCLIFLATIFCFVQTIFGQFEIDGDLFRDLENQREWVRLYVTSGMSYQQASSETMQGGLFEGFQIATSQDFVEMSAAYNFNGVQILPDLPLHSPEYPSIEITDNPLTCLFVNSFFSDIGGLRGILGSELSENNEKDALSFIVNEPVKIYETESFEQDFASDDYGIFLFREFCVSCQPLLGDVNLDGAINLFDVTPFVDLLSTGGFQLEADIDQNGVVDLLDVAPFVELLTVG